MGDCCELCQGFTSLVACDCHRSYKYDHCETCDDQEFLKLYPLVPYVPRPGKFSMFRGAYRYSRRAKRLYTILTGEDLPNHTNPPLYQRLNTTLVTVYQTLYVNFINHSCRSCCVQCLPIVEWYPEKYQNHLILNGDDEHGNAVSLNVSSYILALLDKPDCLEAIRNVCEATDQSTLIEELE